MKKGWQKLAVGTVCEVVNGGTPKTGVAEYWGGKHQWITPAEMGKRATPYVAETERTLTDAGLNNSSARPLPPHSVILSSRAPIGHLVINTVPMATNQGCKGLIPGKALDCKFLYYHLSSIVDVLNALGTGATFKELSGGKLKEVTIPVPPLPEQHRIVAILDEAFEGLATAQANAERNLQNARAIFESHLQAVFSKRGEGWVEKRLGDICDRVSVGHVGPTSEFYCDESVGIPFLRSQNVRPGKLDWDGIQYITKEFHGRLRKSQLRFGDLLFVRVGANRGDCCAVLEDVAELNCANIVFARPTQGNAAYLERYCQSPPGRAQLLGMTTGAAQGVINTSSVAELVVPLPPRSEQDALVAKLDSLREETQRFATLYERKLAALAALKKSLLHQAFTGKL